MTGEGAGMDSATHLAVGVGLAGLSHLDPLVAQDPEFAAAVWIGAIAGSQAPDLDALLRFKSTTLYLRHHRGITHSLPAILIWSASITAVVAWIIGTPHYGRLFIWTTVAVVVHIVQDLFNVYGTRALWPFSKRWIAWKIIHIFDPLIFTAHLAGIILWTLNAAPPQLIFPALYGLLFFYYLYRSWTHTSIRTKLIREDAACAPGEQYTVFPTRKPGVWNVVRRTADGSFRIGEWRRRRLEWVEQVKTDEHPAVEASKSNPDIQALLRLTDHAYAECIAHRWGFEVRWIDIRYRHRKQYPFVAIVLFDRDLHVIDSYVGWLSRTQVERRRRLQFR